MPNTTTIDADGNPVEESVSWIGNEVAFNIGERPIKIWELLAGIVAIAIILPLFFGSGGSSSSSSGGSGQGITIINKTTTSQNKPAVKRRATKKRKRRQIKSITYK
jgi:hypothetical protein